MMTRWAHGTAAGLLAGLALGLLGAAPAAAATGCDQLVVERLPSDATRVELLATAPTALAGADLPSSAFEVLRGDTPVPVSVTRLRQPDIDLVVALTATPTTSRAGFEQARLAARELLVELPPGAAVAVVVPGRVLTPLGDDRQAALTAVAGLLLPPQGAVPDALAVAQSQLDGRGGEHVVVIGDQGADLPPTAGGAPVHTLHYGPRAEQQPLGCPGSGRTGPLVAAVDDLVGQLSRQYLLGLAGPAGGALRVGVQHQGTSASADVEPRRSRTPLAARTPAAAGTGSGQVPVWQVALILGAAVVFAATGGILLSAERSARRTAAAVPQGGR